MDLGIVSSINQRVRLIFFFFSSSFLFVSLFSLRMQKICNILYIVFGEWGGQNENEWTTEKKNIYKYIYYNISLFFNFLSYVLFYLVRFFVCFSFFLSQRFFNGSNVRNPANRNTGRIPFHDTRLRILYGTIIHLQKIISQRKG